MEQTPQSQLKLLVAKGKEQGYLTYAEVNDHLPQDIVDSDQIEEHHPDDQRYGYPGSGKRPGRR